MKAIILAAGKGVRLNPITDLVPKPLLPIHGQPILAAQLEGLSAAGVQEVAIVIGHLGHKIRKFVADSQRYGLQVKYYEQTEQKGSGHAVMQVPDFLDDDVIIMAGDTAFTPDHITSLVDFHHQHRADLSLCLKRLPPERIAKTSLVNLEDGYKVTSFIEKPDVTAETGNLAAALLHIYSPSLKKYLEQISVSPRGELELTAVIPVMIADGLRVVGLEISPLPRDLTDVRDLLALNFPYLSSLLTDSED